MIIIFGYKGKNYNVYFLSERNTEGCFSCGYRFKNHPGGNITDFHATYPSNGKFHATTEGLVGDTKMKISFWTNQIIIKKDEEIVLRLTGNNMYNELISFGFRDFIPFDHPRSAPSLFTIINSVEKFYITNLSLNVSPDLMTAVFPEYPDNKIDYDKDLFVNLATHEGKVIVVEIFVSNDGVSNQAEVELIKEKLLDDKKPIIKARVLYKIPIKNH